jgi:hypothetical protein
MKGGRGGGGGGRITFVLDLAVGVVAGGVALVGAEVGLRRPDVEPFPHHRVGPQLQHAPAAPTSSDKEAKRTDTEAEENKQATCFCFLPLRRTGRGAPEGWPRPPATASLSSSSARGCNGRRGGGGVGRARAVQAIPREFS